MQVYAVVPNTLSPVSCFSAVVIPQRLENVLGNKIGETQLENTWMDDRH